MGEAIAAATGNKSGTNWIHTAIVEVRRDSVWIIDATIKRGVDRHPLDTFLVDFTHRDGTLPELMVMRPSGIDVDAAIQRAHSYCGRAYDARFLPDNEDLYCTELVQLCYLDADGQSIFPSGPMNFLAPDGSLPPYWERMFRQLNMRPPQGLPGTNPQRLSESPMLKKVPGIKF